MITSETKYVLCKVSYRCFIKDNIYKCSFYEHLKTKYISIISNSTYNKLGIDYKCSYPIVFRADNVDIDKHFEDIIYSRKRKLEMI